MKLKFDVTAKEYGILRDILTDMLPPDSRVWVFGSRAKNTVRFNSDIDLALEPAKGKPLPKGTLARLKDAFNDAPLPYRVDVLDINDVSKEFQTIIRQQAIAFPLAKKDKVPALRFPEFGGEWVEKRLSQLLETIIDNRGKTPPITSKGIPLIEVNAIGNRNVKYDAVRKYVSQKTFHTWFRKHIKKNDILFSTVGNTALISLYCEHEICSIAQNIVGLRTANSVPSFIYYMLSERNNNLKFKRIEMIAVQPSVKVSHMIHLMFSTPTLPEQQKIATFLSAIDTKITQLTKKKTLLEQYKRGVMQKLFSQELRFKDAQGKAFPDWVETTIGELGYFYYGKSAPKFSLSPDAPTPCVRYGELYSKYGMVIDNVDSRTSIDPKNLKFSKGGEILVPRVGEDPQDFATCCYLPHEGVAIGEMISVFNTNQNGLFYTYYFRTLVHQFARVVEGASVSNLYYSYLEPIEIGKPHLEEQQKIADFLSSIDQKINLVTTELEHCQTFKKGLMQQMFV